MQTSDQINELAAALAKAQGQVEGAAKNAANPFFKSKYADLESVWDACRQPLTANGLAVIQSPTTETVGETLRVSVETLLVHQSGQWVRGIVTVSAKEDSPQAVGSCISYLKRYALQSFAGVAPTDDDAEAAHGRGNGQTSKPQAVPTAPKGYREWLADLSAVADEGTGALQAMWKASLAEFRAYLTATNAAQWDTLKARAAKVKGASVSA